MVYYTYKETPMGEALFVKDDDTLVGLHWKIFRRAPLPATTWVEDAAAFSAVFAQLDEYYAGNRQVFDIAFSPQGTAFQMDVWRELQKIPHGHSSSYQAIATAIGRPKAVRAVGTAIGSNPISILIPCHRVLTSDQRLGGYAGGIDAKRSLLNTENVVFKE